MRYVTYAANNVCLPVCLLVYLFVYLFVHLLVCFCACTHDQYPMTKVYQKLFPVILQLACDVERVRKNCTASAYIHVKHIVTFFSGQVYVESVLGVSLIYGCLHPLC